MPRLSFCAVLAKFVLRMRINCRFSASDQHSDVALRFNDSDFLKESNTLTIRRFHAVTLTFDLLTLNVCITSNVTCSNSVVNFSNIEQVSASGFDDTMISTLCSCSVGLERN